MGVTETSILTASIVDGTFAWNADPRSCLVYAVGKQRARLLLGADILAAYADNTVSSIVAELSSAVEGWEGERKRMAADISLTDKQKQAKDAEIDREIDRLRKEMERFNAFDLDRYLYEVAKATLLEEVEFGQLTSLLKKHILDRRSRPQTATFARSWGSGDERTSWIVVQISSKGGDLLSAVHEGRSTPPVGKESFLGGHMAPLTWLLEWLLGNESLGLELGRSELKAARTLSPWEKDMDARLRSLHREIIRRACCIRGLVDALELVPGSRNGPLHLRLRNDFIASFLPAFSDYRSLAERFERAREMDLAGLVVIGMGGSGKTTFLRRCYDLLKEDEENRDLNEEIDPKSTAFVVGHIFRDITVPLLDGRKRFTLCWMDTAGSEDYRLLGQQLTVSVRELKRKMFLDRPVDYNLLFMWSYEPGYDPVRDLQGFEDVLSRFMDEVENLGYFDLDRPGKMYLLLNKADIAVQNGIADRFASEHEQRFRAVMERKGMPGESLGFVSTLKSDEKEISDKFLASVFGLSDQDWKRAFVSVRAGINQGVMGNLLESEDANLFKREVYDRFSGSGQEAYLRETVAWIDRFLGAANRGGATTRALLRSLRAFLSGEMEGDAVA